MDELTLPAFELDCRVWLVAGADDAELTEALGGAPVLAVLSTAVVEHDELRSVGAVLSLGLLDDGAADRAHGISQLEDSDDDRVLRYLVPAPRGQLGLLAEFTFDSVGCGALQDRVEALMASFRWAG